MYFNYKCTNISTFQIILKWWLEKCLFGQYSFQTGSWDNLSKLFSIKFIFTLFLFSLWCRNSIIRNLFICWVIGCIIWYKDIVIYLLRNQYMAYSAFNKKIHWILFVTGLWYFQYFMLENFIGYVFDLNSN